MSRRCTKRRFRDRIAAELWLARIRNKSDRLEVPNRSYACPYCHGWHLTHQELREATK